MRRISKHDLNICCKGSGFFSSISFYFLYTQSRGEKRKRIVNWSKCKGHYHFIFILVRQLFKAWMNIIFASPMNMTRMDITGKKKLLHTVIFILHGQGWGESCVSLSGERRLTICLLTMTAMLTLCYTWQS